MPSERSRDLAIPPGRYIHILDRTKGHVQTIAGPNKISLSETEIAVKWDPSRNDYDECPNPEDAVCANVVARLGEYVVLTNPASDRVDIKHPEDGKVSQPPKLDVGNVVIITGPATFSLWWQQGATVIPGHQLRSNQFLVVEVTNDKLAKENWAKAIFKRATPADPQGRQAGSQESAANPDPKTVSQAPTSSVLVDIHPDTFTMGQRIIIRGTEVSFFIPPTGMRVVPDEKNSSQFVREAVTLESLQYCVLKDENGKKNFVSGPAVVFPKPTETFVEDKGGSRIFKAIELNPNSGIHVMVTADYEEGGQTVKAGTELFITGATTSIYYPRAEHAIIKYDGENQVHFATAIPAGEGRYVMDKKTGEVALVTGPKMLLLDPTKSVMVRRVLTDSQAELWYPGNTKALEFNRELAASLRASGFESFADSAQRMQRSALTSSLRGYDESPVGAGADTIRRSSAYTPPRSITLDNKFAGAVAVGVWQGYAVQVIGKDGKRRIEVGPKTVLLQYAEDLGQLSLSTGKPKTTDTLRNTAYLKLAGNQVSDIITVETSDNIEIRIKVGYQVEFVGESSKWFDVDNYVKLITDHCRSILRGVARQHSVADFVAKSVVIIRDAILGARPADKERPGQVFPQNNSRVYDVEVLEVKIANSSVEALIRDTQQEIIRGNLEMTRNQQRLKVARENQGVEREILVEQEKTAAARHKAAIEASMQRLEQTLQDQKVGEDAREAAKKAELALQSIQNEIAEATLARSKAEAEQKHAIEVQILELKNRELAAQTEAVKTRIEAIKPELIAAIQASSDRDALVKVMEQFGIAAYLRDQSVGAAVDSMLEGTSLGAVFKKLVASQRGDRNGSGSRAPEAPVARV